MNTTSKDNWRKEKVGAGGATFRCRIRPASEEKQHKQNLPHIATNRGTESIPRRVGEIKRKQRPQHPVASGGNRTTTSTNILVRRRTITPYALRAEPNRDRWSKPIISIKRSNADAGNRKPHGGGGHNGIPLLLRPREGTTTPKANENRDQTHPDPPRDRSEPTSRSLGRAKSISASRAARGWRREGISYLARRGAVTARREEEARGGAGALPLVQRNRDGGGMGRVGIRAGYISLPRRVLSPRLLRDGRGGRGREKGRRRGLE
ncbi:hypothetical protein SEVIR_5G335701v4 [Setaria viridis]